jgi:lactoylglutathione lyase
MKIEHIAIWTKDLEAMKSFYTQHFEGVAGSKYTNITKNFQSYFITFASGARLELMQMPGVLDSLNNIDEQYIGLAHIAFSVGSKEKVDFLTEKLRQEGFKVVGEPRYTGDGYYESCILDPEGNRVEITQ